MKSSHTIISLLGLLSLLTAASAQVPQLLNYQGRVTSGGTNFTGNGQFKFALVNGAGTTSYWSHDGTSTAGGQPTTTLVLPAANGLFAVLLGDPVVMPTPIPATTFTNADVRLRVWFSDGVAALQQLVPDQRIAAVGYALIAGTVPDGAITASKLAPGAVGAAQLGAGVIGAAQLGAGAVTAAALAPGAVGNAALAAGAVTGDKIQPATITDANISPTGIDAGKIVGGDLTATRLNVGMNNVLGGAWSTIAGGTNNTASAYYASVGGGYQNIAGDYGAIVGGGLANVASNQFSTIAGGQLNTAGGQGATIGGGNSNTANGQFAFVGGGQLNTASGGNAVLAGGAANSTSGGTAVVAGGQSNNASGDYATVPGGDNNVAAGKNSFAAGHRAKANHQGCFIWADSVDADFATDGPNIFRVRCTGGALYETSTIAGGVGAKLEAGANAWSSFSDRNGKENFQLVDARAVLAKLVQMPVTEWNLKSQAPAIRHIGPMAQDFKAAFAVGEDDRHISTSDADGVTFAAIKGLYEVVQDKDKEIAELRQEMKDLRTQMKELAKLRSGGQ